MNTQKYDIEIENAKKEVSEFFGFKIEDINIKIADSRAECDKFLNRKTADWEVGITNLSQKSILLLNPDQWGKEAPSHKSEEFPFLVKHELTHVYTDYLSENKALPMWLFEGLAGVVSGQYKNAKVKYFEENFCTKLDTPINWNQRANSGAYSTAYLFTYYLIDKHRFKMIEKLIKSSLRYYSYSRFDKIVVDVFGINLGKLEQEFLDSLE